MDAYRTMVNYTEARRHQPLNEANFGKLLHKVFPDVQKIRKTEDGRRKYFYVGLKWRDDTPPDECPTPMGI